MDRTIHSVHWFRRNARKVERELQAQLDAGLLPGPRWARGVRVEKAGRLQWAVVFTRTRGR